MLPLATPRLITALILWHSHRHTHSFFFGTFHNDFRDQVLATKLRVASIIHTRQPHPLDYGGPTAKARTPPASPRPHQTFIRKITRSKISLHGRASVRVIQEYQITRLPDTLQSDGVSADQTHKNDITYAESFGRVSGQCHGSGERTVIYTRRSSMGIPALSSAALR